MRRWRVLLALFFSFILLTIIQDVVREIIVYRQGSLLIEEELQRSAYQETKSNVTHTSDEFESRIHH